MVETAGNRRVDAGQASPIIRGMDRLPRLLVLIGSGELAPRMTRVERAVVGRLAAARDGAGAHAERRRVRAAIVDTPYGFQSNADALSAEMVEHFGARLDMSVSIASYRRSDDDVLAHERAFERIREADFVFSGPGSPSYAVRHWSGSAIPQLFADRLASGGALVLASAAALAIGCRTLPVYEIYKAGEDPYWLPGLDVLSTIGINAAVMTHYDNTEGGSHDTRFCFMGKRRLATLEEQLPEQTAIVGVDEHTALVIDLDEERAIVHGRGGVTVRRRGRSVVFAAGQESGLDELRAVAPVLTKRPPESTLRPGLVSDAVEDGDVAGLVRSLLSEVAESASRSEIVQLGEIAERALRDRVAMVGPLVETLIELRQRARASGDWPTADAIRARMVELGIEVRDVGDGTTDAQLPVHAR